MCAPASWRCVPSCVVVGQPVEQAAVQRARLYRGEVGGVMAERIQRRDAGVHWDRLADYLGLSHWLVGLQPRRRLARLVQLLDLQVVLDGVLDRAVEVSPHRAP